MTVRVKETLKKSKNPGGQDLRGKKGEVIQSCDDGWYLVDFGKLQWYIHELDFTLHY